jgi:hypothetical protein
MKDIISVDFKPFFLNDLPESVKISCRQSAKVQEERLKLFQLSQDKTTYLVIFDNEFSYGHVSGVDLYNYLRLKIQYEQISNSRKAYLQELQKEQYNSAVINTKEIASASKQFFLETEPYLNEIIKAMQLYPFPCGEIEKIIDETTNQVVMEL